MGYRRTKSPQRILGQLFPQYRCSRVCDRFSRHKACGWSRKGTLQLVVREGTIQCSFVDFRQQTGSCPSFGTFRSTLKSMKILEQLDMAKIETHTWTITACSAKTQEGLEDGLTWLVENVKKWSFSLMASIIYHIIKHHYIV